MLIMLKLKFTGSCPKLKTAISAPIWCLNHFLQFLAEQKTPICNNIPDAIMTSKNGKKWWIHWKYLQLFCLSQDGDGLGRCDAGANGSGPRRRSLQHRYQLVCRNIWPNYANGHKSINMTKRTKLKQCRKLLDSGKNRPIDQPIFTSIGQRNLVGMQRSLSFKAILAQLKTV